MKKFKHLILFMCLGILLTLGLCFQNRKNTKQPTQKDNKGFAVVELFTSEGCSSCPPADALIEKLEKENNEQLYILAFHVDYWDRQGWKDRFSQHTFSLRQKQYANWLHLNTVYTPQMVINGKTELIGSDENAASGAINSALQKTSPGDFSLQAKVKHQNIEVTYSGAQDNHKNQMIIALVQKSAFSKVAAGENAAKNLTHVQIVRELYQRELSRENKISLSVPANFKEGNWEIIGFVQRKDNGEIVQAAKFAPLHSRLVR